MHLHHCMVRRCVVRQEASDADHAFIADHRHLNGGSAARDREERDLAVTDKVRVLNRISDAVYDGPLRQLNKL